ncbi:MAG: universal stress protein [Bacteroidales bacterium]|nr:universal stress protein [Bacteroidales bacterium]
MENTLLVPIDFSQQSLIALDQALGLAESSNLSVTIMTVVKTNSNFWGVFSEDEQKDLEIKIEQKLKKLANESKEQRNVEVYSIIRRGKVVDEILRVADHLKPKMLIMGTTAGINITRKIIGSRALHIIKTSPYPVLSIKGKVHSKGCENILLPIDATKHTEQKVKMTIEIAKWFNSKITILTALEKNNQDKIDIVNTKLQNIKTEIEAHQIVCDTEYLYTDDDRGIMATSIVGFAHKVQADLMVLMTQQEGSFKEFFLGSLAKNIIFSSDIPVLTINPQ